MNAEGLLPDQVCGGWAVENSNHHVPNDPLLAGKAWGKVGGQVEGEREFVFASGEHFFFVLWKINK